MHVCISLNVVISHKVLCLSVSFFRDDTERKYRLSLNVYDVSPFF